MKKKVARLAIIASISLVVMVPLSVQSAKAQVLRDYPAYDPFDWSWGLADILGSLYRIVSTRPIDTNL